MKVADVMTTEVVTAKTTTPYKELVRLMLDHGITGVPVLDEHHRLIGIVTEADLVDHEAYPDEPRRLLTVLRDVVTGPPRESIRKGHAVNASGLMTENPITVGPDETLRVAARRMLELKLKRLPVADPDGHLLGIVSRRDLLRAYARPDEDIADSIRDVLRSPLHVPENVVVDRFTVRDGVVELHGAVRFPSDGAVVEGAVRSIPGVLSVHADLVAREHEPRVSTPQI
jgi:CBS domain-containing protein